MGKPLKAELKREILKELAVYRNPDKKNIANKVGCDIGQVMRVIKDYRIQPSRFGDPTYDPTLTINDTELLKMKFDQPEPETKVSIQLTPEDRLQYLIDYRLANNSDLEAAAAHACLSVADAEELLKTKCRKINWSNCVEGFGKKLGGDTAMFKLVSSIIRHPEFKTRDMVISHYSRWYTLANIYNAMNFLTKNNLVKEDEFDDKNRVTAKRLYIDNLTKDEWKIIVDGANENMTDSEIAELLGYVTSAIVRVKASPHFTMMRKMIMQEEKDAQLKKEMEEAEELKRIESLRAAKANIAPKPFEEEVHVTEIKPEEPAEETSVPVPVDEEPAELQLAASHGIFNFSVAAINNATTEDELNEYLNTTHKYQKMLQDIEGRIHLKIKELKDEEERRRKKAEIEERLSQLDKEREALMARLQEL